MGKHRGNRRAPALALEGLVKGELDFVQLASRPRRVVPFSGSRDGDRSPMSDARGRCGEKHRRRLISSPVIWSRMKQIQRSPSASRAILSRFNYSLISIRWHLVWGNADTIVFHAALRSSSSRYVRFFVFLLRSRRCANSPDFIHLKLLPAALIRY